jgi:hypothetical protein
VTARTVVWFSAGAASAVAAKLTLATSPDATIVYVDPGSEHEDNPRFIADCEHWFDHEVTRLRSDRYQDTWQVWEERRYLVGPTGALCTGELKKKVRFGFERPDDRQVFGYTTEEKGRAHRFRVQNPGVDLVTPLITADLTKRDCLAMVDRAGIELPAMYRLGYQNNNCVGCPKGGIGYWNKIRRDFPDVFARMARLERDIGHSVCSEEIPGEGRKTRPVWLDELDPDRGDHADEPDFECSLMCALAEDSLSPPTAPDPTEDPDA